MKTSNAKRHVRAALAALLCLPATVMAQSEWPQRPITLVVPYPPGGPTDIVARVVAKNLGEQLQQTIVVDNRAGAGGNIGAELVARSKPDGYTLLLATTAHAINKSLFKNLNYDVGTSFTPITLLTEGPLVVVTRSDLGADNVQDLIRLAKKADKKLTFASSGNGQSTHLSAALFNAMSAIHMVHVPYKGSAPAMTDLIGGQVDVMFNTLLSSLPYIKEGKLKALAVTGEHRSAVLPAVPTVAESGLAGYSAHAWNGLLAPKGTPAPITDKLSVALKAALANQQVRQTFSAQGFDARWLSPAQFSNYLSDEISKWKDVVNTSGATVN
ncbi:MAG TPA: tripartite tricarboxylate transporter substrate binding protein [Advenella sp.]|nr:tripartite tricarboxylate transporter substrate binding protein [Advenella sp.]